MAKGERRTRIELAEFEAKIVQLRRNGIPFEKIAQSTGDSVSNVLRAFARAIKRIPEEDVNELRAMQKIQLEEIFQRSMALAQKGNAFALDRALKALDQQAKLFGLNAPVKTQTELTGADGGPIETANSLANVNFDDLTQEERDALRKIAERRIKAEAVHH